MKTIFHSLLALIFLSLACNVGQAIQIDSDFAGGNIIVEKISGDSVYVRPALRDTEGEWFYWNFKVRHAAGKTKTFQFTRDNTITSKGPAFSRDNGRTWAWYGEGSVQNNNFTFTFTPQDTMVWFCMAIPYTQSNLDEFIKTLPTTPNLKTGTFCITKGGRKVEKITITPEDTAPEYKVLITARHHACEMMANYVIEGLISTTLIDDSAQWLREHVEFMIIPFVDKDGVEAGDQGKNRKPRDHNRDYAGESLYNTTAAIRQQIPEWGENKLNIVLDIHCPWIRNEENERIFLVGSNDQDIAKQQVVFSKLIEKHHHGELPFMADEYLAFGTSWNTGNNYSKGQSAIRWAATLDNKKLAASLEFPYAVIHGVPVTVENTREFGQSLALAMQDYLQNH